MTRTERWEPYGVECLCLCLCLYEYLCLYLYLYLCLYLSLEAPTGMIVETANNDIEEHVRCQRTKKKGYDKTHELRTSNFVIIPLSYFVELVCRYA